MRSNRTLVELKARKLSAYINSLGSNRTLVELKAVFGCTDIFERRVPIVP